MIKIALPGGDLRNATADVLAAAELTSSEYAQGSRSLRVAIDGREDVTARVFREKDIPVQIALGNYDLGIVSDVWVQEFLARHADEGLVPLRPLSYGVARSVLAAPAATIAALGPLRDWPRWSGLRIATEFPWLAQRLALRLRLPDARIQALWGAAEAYPPEDAEACLISVPDELALQRHGLMPLARVTAGPAWLIGSRAALERRGLAAVLDPLLRLEPFTGAPPLPETPRVRPATWPEPVSRNRGTLVRLALPDGHAQPHTFHALAAAGIAFEGYDEKTSVRRPKSGIEGLEIKVIRPQDMPGQVAIGNFDLAVTGRDWLMDHRYAFPSSPVREVADLHRSRYTLVAVVDEDLPAQSMAEAVVYWRKHGRETIRVASEYPHLADHYARSALLGRYAVVPIAGASEGFVPDDGEILIEGTETGRSLIANRLRVLDQMQISTNCMIAREDWPLSPGAALIKDLIDRLKAAPAPEA